MSRLIQQFQSLEPWYKQCHALYTKTKKTLTENSDIFNVITLCMLRNKVSDGSVDTIREMLETRIRDLKPSEDLCRSTDMDSLDSTSSTGSDSSSPTHSTKESSYIAGPGSPRELKILLTGDVNAGKSSVLNVLMGGAYLPTHTTKTTIVPCEIHNSDRGYAELCFGEEMVSEIKLSHDASGESWTDLKEVIKTGKRGDNIVTRVKIFWPLKLLRVKSKWESDPEHTPVKGVFGTLNDLLKGIEDKVTQHGVAFNPTSVMFLLNRGDLLDEDPTGETNVILKQIQKTWPIVTQRQLHMISCRKMLKGKKGMKGEWDINCFKDTICDFLDLLNQRNIEEHCLWLTKLLEGIAAYFGTGYNWLSFDECLKGIQKHAEEDSKYLEKEIENISKKKSSFYQKLLEAAQKRKEALKTYLTREMQSVTNTATDTRTVIETALAKPECGNIKVQYDLKIEQVFEEHQRELKQKTKLVENDAVPLNSYVIRNEITVAVGRLVMTHVAVVEMPVRTIEKELAYICQDPKKEQAVVINQLADWCERQADNERQKRIEFLKMQRKLRSEITNIKPMVDVQTTGKHKQYANFADTDVKKLFKLYVTHVLKHEFAGGFEEASKDWFVRYRRGKSPTSGGLPQHTDIYREVIMLRALTTKAKEEHDKKGHFQLLQGTASLVQEHARVLGIGMERCDIVLNEVISDLHTDKSGWEGNGGRQKMEYALGAAKGLQFMHENGFVHRDVKPENFLVNRGFKGAADIVKICAVGHTEEMANMSPGYGTRGYCAPEVLSSERYSVKSDVYSLGLVLWEMWYCKQITCRPGEIPSLEPEPEGAFGVILPRCLDVCAEKRPDCSFIVQELEKQLTFILQEL